MTPIPNNQDHPNTDSDRSFSKLPDIPPIIDVAAVLDQDLVLNDKLPGLKVGEPTALLLDINNLFSGAKENNFRIDYAKLANIFAARCDLRYKAAFTAVRTDSDDMMAWIRFMENSGYVLITKPLRVYTDLKGKKVHKGNLDIELAVEAMSLSPEFGHIIIGSCDGDFIPLVNKLRAGNFRKVSVLGIKNPRVGTMSEDLIAACDNFYNMYDFRDMVSHIRRSDNP